METRSRAKTFSFAVAFEREFSMSERRQALA
jgi:hypothetical protein